MAAHLVELLARWVRSRRRRSTTCHRVGDETSPTAERPCALVRCDVEETEDGDYERITTLRAPRARRRTAVIRSRHLMANSAGTKRLLDVAQSARARFLMASTSEVYGDPLVHPQPESYWGNVDPIGPRSMYDESKRFAEALTVAYSRERGVDARIVRIFNAYGPRMQLDDGRMPSSFVAAAIRGEPLLVHDDGAQTRSLCYVGATALGCCGPGGGLPPRSTTSGRGISVSSSRVGVAAGAPPLRSASYLAAAGHPASLPESQGSA